MAEIALIIGITGQDGVYLAELLYKDLEFYGTKRRGRMFSTDCIDHFCQDQHVGDRHFVTRVAG